MEKYLIASISVMLLSVYTGNISLKTLIIISMPSLLTGMVIIGIASSGNR